MDMNKPVSGELAALLPLIAHTMEGSVQALRQSSALAEVLMKKGLVQKEELDSAMAANGHLANTLRDVLKKFGQEDS